MGKVVKFAGAKVDQILAALRGGFFQSAAAIAEIRGRMKKASLGWINIGAQAVKLELVEYRRPDRGDRRTAQILRATILEPRARATSMRRRTWPRLVSAIASMRPAAISSIAAMMFPSAA